MAFVDSDMYTTSGTAPLRNCWTENVTKHDTSSFYNWEEDNQPIHDLEERTYLNWEKLGFPTSSIPGMILTVSADANLDVDGNGVNDCHTKLFNDLSSCVAALPERITFPIVIEVGSYGDLGGVEINGIDFGPSGSLEIVNRNFAKGYSDWTQASATEQAWASYDLISSVSSFDISATFADTSCVGVSTPVLSANTGNLFDPRTYGNTRSVTQFPGYKVTHDSGGNVETTRMAVSISNSTSAFVHFNSPSALTLPIYEVESGLGNELLGDVSTMDFISAGQANKGATLFNTVEEQNNCQSLVTNNYLRYVTIEGCNGPIFFRNFFCDGHHIEKDVVTIRNSNGVMLENIVAIRGTKNGFLIEDSEVVASRGLVAYRNYGFSTGTTRLNPVWTNVSALGPLGKDPAAGLHLINSNLTLSSTLSVEQAGQNSYADANDYFLNFSRNSNGIVLENSVLQGGISREGGDPEACTYFLVQLNAEWGIKATNSIFSMDGRVKLEGNAYGFEAVKTKIILDEFEGSTNQHEVFNLQGSQLLYGKNGIQVPSYTTRFLNSPYHQMHFFSNAQNIIADNSEINIVSTSSLDQNFGKWKTYAMFGVNSRSSDPSFDRVRVPEIELKNNSTGKFVHFAQIAKGPLVDQTIANSAAIYGQALAAKNGSHAIFQGSKHAATMLIGPNAYSHSKRMAGAYAAKNSSLEFNGPTLLFKHGVNALAEDNSTITFGPQREKTTGAVDVSSFDLDLSGNHTSVELHSTKACLVVNRGSTLNIKDVGDYQSCWASGAAGQIIEVSGMTYDTSGELDLAHYTSAGSFQFYPNPNDITDYNDYDGPGIANVQPSTVALFLVNDVMSQETDHNRWNYYLTDAIFNPAEQVIGVGGPSPSAIAGGGVCVRATNGSHINVQNVNFPCGYWNPSGPIFDTSSNANLLCDRLFIWNVADNSTMHASHLAVSGLHGLDAAYHGPSGVWGSGVGGDAVAHAAPPCLDTSNLSVLDWYGAMPGDQIPNRAGTDYQAGHQSFLNNGPFRIYVSVPGYTHLLTTSSVSTEDIFGAPPQIFAQGYQASGSLSAVPGTSGIWDEVQQWDEAGTGFQDDKFYYTSAMLDGGTAQRIILDQSAANVFANAKHGASGKSGRQKIFTIYDPHQTQGGEGAINTQKDRGRGFKSSNVFDLGRDE